MTDQAPDPVRVAIVEDNALVRKGLSELIGECEGMEVCGEACDTSDANDLIGRERPDVVLVDLSLGKGSGYDVLLRSREIDSSMSALVVSSMPPSTHVRCALEAGAKGFVAKHEIVGHVVRAIRAVVLGAVYVSPDAGRLGFGAGG